MRLAFTTFGCPLAPLDEVLRLARSQGYHGVELRCDAGHKHGAEVWTTGAERARIRGAFAYAEVQVVCLGTSLQLSDPKAVRQALPRLELAAELGAPAVRVVAGVPPPFTDEAFVIDTVARQLHEIGQLADERGLGVWLETHDIMARGQDAAAVVRRANHPRVGVCYDNLHPFRMGEAPTDTLHHLRGLVRHVHFHDGLNSPDQVVVTPMGQGQLPLDEMFLELLGEGYDGYLTGEWFYDQYGDVPELALEQYRKDAVELAARHDVEIDLKLH